MTDTRLLSRRDIDGELDYRTDVVKKLEGYCQKYSIVSRVLIEQTKGSQTYVHLYKYLKNGYRSLSYD